MIDKTLRETEQKMAKSIEVLERELASIRTGRASATLVEHLMVDYYGAPTPLKQLATISVPEARLITIQPWDRGAVQAVEKAIQKSELGLNPATDGTLVRVPIPALTEERRKDLVKIVRKRIEDGRIAVRNVRRDSIDALKGAEKKKEISQDDLRRAEQAVQKLTDRFIEQGDKAGAKKEAELMEV